MPPRRKPLDRGTKGLARTGPPGRSTRPPRRSAAGKKRDAEFEAVRPIVLARDGHQCQFHVRVTAYLSAHPDADVFLPPAAARCEQGLDVHHVLPRKHGGTNDPANLVTLCAHHHLDVVHANPKMAKTLGLLRSWWDAP